MTLAITDSLAEMGGTVVWTNWHITGGSNIKSITIADSFVAETMSRAYETRVSRWASVDLVGYIKSRHIVRIIAEEMQKGGS